jgi:lysozyme family protein
MIGRILGAEGGYVNNPADPGGETKWGIAKRSYPDVNIAALTRDDAIEIYHRDFWPLIGGGKMHDAIAFQALDAAVNNGSGNAVRFLQRAVDVADDGHLGPVSLASINAQPVHAVLMRFIAERAEFFTKLSTFPTFGKGWVRERIANNLRYAALDS